MQLVNAGPIADPLDKFARSSSGCRQAADPEDNEGHYLNDGKTSNRQFMRKIAKRNDQSAEQCPAKFEAWMNQYQPLWMMAKRNCFGHGRSGQYARMWDTELGLMTDDDGSIILRVERDLDHARLREDITKYPDNLLRPLGRDNRAGITIKAAAVSGSLTPAQWDATIVTSVLREGLPILFLPHVTQKPLKTPERWFVTMMEFEKYCHGLPTDIHRIRPIRGKLDDWGKSIENRVRSRLKSLPAAYEFFVLQVLRELPAVCVEIARFMAVRDSTVEEVAALIHDLRSHAAHGIALGLESLAFHCCGIEGCDKATARSLLAFVREKGSVSRRDIQRKLQKLDAESLGVVLTKLVAEGLVTLEGERTVHAVTLEAFLRSLPSRTGYSAPELLTKAPRDQRDVPCPDARPSSDG